ncbi:MAG: hypothetical protein A3F43_01500 [Gammaproteobacteria bacterium RIFCSPHIGHO2_12_FULL_42_10]|nr:MAG: hypothetical protein A3F43_01500 [Gammaproteobacteria bacterium RIFCSPHIGHO2_12_FULL_42_10]
MQLTKPQYKIVMREFCNQLRRIRLKIQKQDSEHIIINTADQLSLNKTLINSLSQEDAHCIGYIAGYEHALQKK